MSKSSAASAPDAGALGGRRDRNPYASFWMAGFEGADHVNAHAEPQDLGSMTGHMAHLEEDYRRVAALGLRSVRESVGWRLSERVRTSPVSAISAERRFDLDRVLRCAEAANRHGLEVLWTLMHYGVPRDVDVFSDDFPDRFAAFAGQTARALRASVDRPPIYTPINEISFLAWAVAHTNFIHPYDREWHVRRQGSVGERDIGWEAKWRLVKASLRAMEAIRAEDPRARFLHVDPLIHVVPPPDAPHLAERALTVADYQWQAWDMLAGTLLPELGGSAEALDLIGINYYHNCQWELHSGQRLEWHLNDPRRVSFSSLLRKAAKRYDRPLLVAETSHVGSGRARWLADVTVDIERALADGVEVQGVCLYPIIDRPDWNNRHHWHNSGLWDIEGARDGSGAMGRRIHLGYAKMLRRSQQRLASVRVSERPMPHLIVFSHLRWSFVQQRPQHLLVRLSRRYHVVFIEEPLRTAEAPYLERSSPHRGVEVLRPHTPSDCAGFHDDQLAFLQPLIAGYLADHLIDDYIVWFSTPMALPLLNELAPAAVVYDCMDELSSFLYAPRQMRQRERALLKRADVVFTAGPRLHESKRQLSDNVLCVLNGVDDRHFRLELAEARQRAGRVDLRRDTMSRPRLGFFGVIDERMDLDLVAHLADSRPDWQLIMVGPVVKIDLASLPQRPNLFWVGSRPYDSLPRIAADWDICLIPFALNDSTAFISPVKTLEYMAMGKPVVSTSIHDVQSLYGDVVTVADGVDEFIDACQAVLDESTSHAADRRLRMRRHIERHSWDAAAAAIEAAIDATLRDDCRLFRSLAATG